MSDNNFTFKSYMNDFMDKLKKYLEERYGEKVSFNLHTTYKANRELTGLTVQFENNQRVCPTIYPEDYLESYKNGIPMKSIVERAGDTVLLANKQNIKPPEPTTEDAPEHISLRIVNTERNQKLLSEVPHFEVSGTGGLLSAYPQWYMNDEMSFRVTRELAGSLGFTDDEVLQIGLSNVINNQKFIAMPMGQMLAGLMGDIAGSPMGIDDIPDTGMQMVILTNESKIQGSNEILNDNALKTVHQMCGGDKDICLLPSSVHEWICIGITPDLSPEILRSMVSDVNASQVALEDQLGDFILKYDGFKLCPVLGETFDMEGPAENLPKFDSFSMKFAM